LKLEESVLIFNQTDYTFLVMLEEFVDTKIRIRKSKKERQHNGQRKKYKMTKKRSTKHIHKSKDRATRTPLKTTYKF
jgi:hypothetical protein